MPRHEPTVAKSAPGHDYAAQFNPGFALDPARVALVVVDMQYASGSRKEGLGRLLAEQGNEAQGAYRFDRIEGAVVPTISRLLEFFRARSLRVIYLTVGSELPDYSDLLPHMHGMASLVGNTEGRREHEILDELRPRPGEAVINKTTMSAFHSSGFERLLRSWGMEQLLFTGVSTNSCVEGTARDAADRGYRCLLVEDGCGAASQRLHDASCENFQRLLGRVAPSAAVMEELAAALGRAAGRGASPPRATPATANRFPSNHPSAIQGGMPCPASCSKSSSWATSSGTSPAVPSPSPTMSCSPASP